MLLPIYPHLFIDDDTLSVAAFSYIYLFIICISHFPYHIYYDREVIVSYFY